MGSQAEIIPPTPRKSPAAGALAAAAVAAAIVTLLVMGIRPQTSPDLGYHLAYGEEFLSTGRPVDTNPYIYTNPAPGDANSSSAGAAAPVRPEPGPGCWYDEQGRYHFANANWLTQAAMACLWRLGNRLGGLDGAFTAMCLLQVCLPMAVFLLVAVTMRRLGASWTVVAMGLLLAAVATYPRRELRPELLGYLMLAAELAVLAGGVKRWRSVAALVVLQLFFVNFHSYWLLGMFMTGAMLADSLAKLLWARWRGPASSEDRAPLPERHGPANDAGPWHRDIPGLRAQALRYAVALGGQFVTAFLNPWTWRGALLPIQTLLFLRAGKVGTVPWKESHHPWAIIHEFASLMGTWTPTEHIAHVAFLTLVGLTCLAAVACLLRRRWGHIAILACMTMVALTMVRNVAPAAIVLTAITWTSLSSWPGEWLARRRPALLRKLAPVACGVVILAGAAFSGAVVTHKLYVSEFLPWRFGWGPSRVMIPMDAFDFFNRNRPVGRLWTDYNTCSNFHFFVQPKPDVPAVTNTWAYPPDVMTVMLDYTLGWKPFEEARRKYNVQTLAIFVDGVPALARQVSRDANWRLAYLDPLYAVFFRADGPDAELARRLEITPKNFDANRMIEQARRWDPVAPYTIHMAAATVYFLGWTDHAIDLFRVALAENPGNFRAWETLGECLAQRGQSRLRDWVRLQNELKYSLADEAHRAGKADWLEARGAYLRAQDLSPESEPGAIGLANIRDQLKALEHGEVKVIESSTDRTLRLMPHPGASSAKRPDATSSPAP